MKKAPLAPNVLARWYYDPKTQLFARVIKGRNDSASQRIYGWKEEEALPKAQRIKIGMLNLSEKGMKIPHIGIRRDSRAHKGIDIYWLYKDTKEGEGYE